MGYVGKHWHGQFGVYWAVLINGVGAYLLAVAGAVAVGAALQAYNLELFLPAVLFAFFLVFIWSLVGIARTCFRTLQVVQMG